MYEVPQQLEYKEKIVFGLTFKQLMYAMLFLPPTIIFFRMDIYLPAKVILMLIPLTFAVCFMFFDLAQKIQDWYWWWRFRNIQDKIRLHKLFGVIIQNNIITIR